MIGAKLNDISQRYADMHDLPLLAARIEHNDAIIQAAACEFPGSTVVMFGHGKAPDAPDHLIGDIASAMAECEFSHTVIVSDGRVYDALTPEGATSLAELAKVRAYNDDPTAETIYLPYPVFMEAGDAYVALDISVHDWKKGIFKTSKCVEFSGAMYLVSGSSFGPGEVGRHFLYRITPKNTFHQPTYTNKNIVGGELLTSNVTVTDDGVLHYRGCPTGWEFLLNGEPWVVCGKAEAVGLLPTRVFDLTEADVMAQYKADNNYPGAGRVDTAQLAGIWMTVYESGHLLRLPGKHKTIFFRSEDEVENLIAEYNERSSGFLKRDVTTADQMSLGF